MPAGTTCGCLSFIFDTFVFRDESPYCRGIRFSMLVHLLRGQASSHRTVEKSHVRYVVFHNYRKYMRFAVSLCIIGGHFWSPFWACLLPSKKRPCRRGRLNFSDFSDQKPFFSLNVDGKSRLVSSFCGSAFHIFAAAFLKHFLIITESTLR